MSARCLGLGKGTLGAPQPKPTFFTATLLPERARTELGLELQGLWCGQCGWGTGRTGGARCSNLLSWHRQCLCPGPGHQLGQSASPAAAGCRRASCRGGLAARRVLCAHLVGELCSAAAAAAAGLGGAALTWLCSDATASKSSVSPIPGPGKKQKDF